MKFKTIQKKLSKKLIFDRSIGVDDTVLLASMGRSGSTFLSNVINYDNRYRVMFEPFRYDKVDIVKEFVYPLYLRPDDNRLKYFDPAQRIISGRVHSDWVNRENTKIFPTARLIKDIRANFFLKWIQTNFPEIKILLLLRHPCAVVASWVAAGFGDGQRARKRLLENDQFVSDTDAHLLAEYMNAATDFERLIFFWCFSYHVPFRQFECGDVCLVFYENLIANSEQEVSRLFKFLGYAYSESEVQRSLSKPSSTTDKNESFYDKEVLRLDRWRDNFSKEQASRAFEILELFGMDAVYGSASSMPDMEAAYGLFAAKNL